MGEAKRKLDFRKNLYAKRYHMGVDLASGKDFTVVNNEWSPEELRHRYESIFKQATIKKPEFLKARAMQGKSVIMASSYNPLEYGLALHEEMEKIEKAMEQAIQKAKDADMTINMDALGELADELFKEPPTLPKEFPGVESGRFSKSHNKILAVGYGKAGKAHILQSFVNNRLTNYPKGHRMEKYPASSTAEREEDLWK